MSISFPFSRMAPPIIKQPVSLSTAILGVQCLALPGGRALSVPQPTSWHRETSPSLDPVARPWRSASSAYCPHSQVLDHRDNSRPLCNPFSNVGYKKGLGEVTELFCTTIVGLDTHFFASVTTQRILLHINWEKKIFF